jgi:hypothetical protein
VPVTDYVARLTIWTMERSCEVRGKLPCIVCGHLCARIMIRRMRLIFLVVLVAGATTMLAACGEGVERQSETGGKGGSLENTAEQGQDDQQGQAGGETPGGAEDGGQLTIIRPGESIYGTSFVNPLVELYGNVYVG